MKLYVKNTLAGLIPLYPSDLDEKKKLTLNKEYEIEIKAPRNYEFHKKFMALVNLGHQNTQLEMGFDTYRKYVTQKAGYYNTYNTPKGVFIEAQSISFASMNEIQFQEVYSRVIDVIIKDIGVTSDEIQQELINFF